MAKNDLWKIIAVVAIAVLIFQPGAVQDLMGTSDSGDQTGDQGGDGIGIDHITEDTTVTLSGMDKYKPMTSASDEGALVYLNGFKEGNVSINSGTYTATPGDPYKVYFGYDDEAGSAYTVPKTGTIPDKGNFKLRGDLVTIDTDMTLNWKDKYGQPATTLAIGNDEEYVASVYFQVDSDEGYGNAEADVKNQVCFVGNTTTPGYSSIELRNANPTSASKAVNDYVANTEFSGNSQSFCYDFKTTEDLEIYEENIIVQANGNPTSTEKIMVIVNDGGLYFNEDTGELSSGYQDEDLNDLGSGVQVKNISVS